MKTTVKCWVSGKVQGVWYRQSTVEMANSLGITGWVRNLSDGRVELVACGEETHIKRLKEWLWKGPTHAEVTGLLCEEIDIASIDVFEIR